MRARRPGRPYLKPVPTYTPPPSVPKLVWLKVSSAVVLVALSFLVVMILLTVILQKALRLPV